MTFNPSLVSIEEIPHPPFSAMDNSAIENDLTAWNNPPSGRPALVISDKSNLEKNYAMDTSVNFQVLFIYDMSRHFEGIREFYLLGFS